MQRLSLAALVVACASTPSLADGASPSELARRAIERRAVEAVIWGMPAVNTELMADQMLKADGRPGQIIYWGKPLDWQNQTLTPNPDTLYFMTFLNTKDVWADRDRDPASRRQWLAQRQLRQRSGRRRWKTPGLLGVDKGKGVKLVDRCRPAIPGASSGRAIEQLAAEHLWQLLPRSLQPQEPRRRRCSRSRSPMASRSSSIRSRRHRNPPATVFIDVKDKSSSIRRSNTTQASLRISIAIVQSEPWLARDRAMIDQLRTIGIEKGKPFAPRRRDESRRSQAASSEAHALLAARYDAGFPPFFEGTHWTFASASPEAARRQSTETSTSPDKYARRLARGITYTYGLYRASSGSAPANSISSTSRTRTARATTAPRPIACTCRRTRRCEQYWSLTAYDRETHALDQGHRPRQPRLQRRRSCKKNADGSVDLYVRAESAGGQGSELGSNRSRPPVRADVPPLWPDKAFFDKAWTLPDVEKVSAK